MLIQTIGNLNYSDEYKQKHLEKFKDLDLLLIKTQDIIREYFKTQDTFSDFNIFQNHLKGQISYYYVCFSSMEGLGYDNYKCIEEIAQKYNKIIFFEEKNPYTELREETTQAIEKIIN